MDRKAIAVIGASVVFIIVWVSYIVPTYLTPKPQPPATNGVAAVNATGTARVPPIGYQTPSLDCMLAIPQSTAGDWSGAEPTYCV